MSFETYLLVGEAKAPSGGTCALLIFVRAENQELLHDLTKDYLDKKGYSSVKIQKTGKLDDRKVEEIKGDPALLSALEQALRGEIGIVEYPCL